jgi:hypothetical protein
MNLFSYFWYSTAPIKSLLHSFILIRKKKSNACTQTLGGNHWLQVKRSSDCTNQLRTPKINALYILDTHTTIFAKLFYSDAIYNVSAAQYTLSAITYTRNVHFNWFNLRSPPENLLFKIMYNLQYFIPLGRIANSTLRECSEIVGECHSAVKNFWNQNTPFSMN